MWLIAGVWTVRWAVGADPGLAWAIACMASALRWGTLSVADAQAASRLFGPAATVGPSVAAAGLVLAVASALLEEARLDGFRHPVPAARVATGAALLGVCILVVLPGVGGPLRFDAVLLWVAVPATAVAVVLLTSHVTRLVPRWVFPVAAAAGLALVASGAR